MTVALSLQAVCVRYGNRVAVDGITLAVDRGELVGLVGPNGSGKSTTLAVAAGLIDPVAGTVSINGLLRADDPVGFATQVGLVPQDCALYDELSATDNLMFFGRLYGLTGGDLRRRVSRALARAGLAERAGHRIHTFSGGMKQRVNLAAALLHEPTVLLLDEPTASLDPASRDSWLVELARLRDDGHAVLFTTHHLDEVERACDRVAVLDAGRLVALGPPAEVVGCQKGGRAVLYGHLRGRVPRFLERSLRQRLGAEVEIDTTGGRLRLAAGSSESLGRALALVLAEGVPVDAFHTPSGTLERVLRRETRLGAT